MGWRRFAEFTGHRGALYALCPGGSPGTFFSGGSDGQVVRWNVQRPSQGELVARSETAIFSLFFSSEPRALLLGDEHGGLHVIDTDAHTELRLTQPHRKGIFSMTLLPGERLAVAGGDGTLSIHAATAHSGSPEDPLLRRIPLCEEKVRALAIDADAARLAVACGDGSVRILEALDLNEQFTLHAHEEGATAVAWHPDKAVLVSGGKDGHLRFWRSDRRFEQLRSLATHQGTIYGIAFSPDGTCCATVSRDRTMKIWDSNTFDPVARLDHQEEGHGRSVNAALWLDPETLISAGDDGRCLAWRKDRSHL